jgi:hypothetical protein
MVPARSLAESQFLKHSLYPSSGRILNIFCRYPPGKQETSALKKPPAPEEFFKFPVQIFRSLPAGPKRDDSAVYKVCTGKELLKLRGDTAVYDGSPHKKGVVTDQSGQGLFTAYIKQIASGCLSDSLCRPPGIAVFREINDQIGPCPFIGNERNVFPYQYASGQTKSPS